NFYDQRLIDLQKDFARQILTHVNPYTQRSYAEEPGVSGVEITNENSLVGLWLEGKLNSLPTQTAEDLNERWNTWLANRSNETSLRAAWTGKGQPLGRKEILSDPLPIGIVNPNAPDSRVQVRQQSLGKFRLAEGVSANNGYITFEPQVGPVI